MDENISLNIDEENIDEETTKTAKAKKLNIPIMTKSMFEEIYKINN